MSSTEISPLLVFVTILGLAHGLEVVRSHTCSFEPPGGACGWVIPTPIGGEDSGIRSAIAPTSLGPNQDVNPGINGGHYAFFYANTSIISSQKVLVFSSYQYVCGLSFSYYASGPLELSVFRFNAGDDLVYSFMDPTSNASMWLAASYNYSIMNSTFMTSSWQMFFLISAAGIGEAEMQDTMDIFLALDNVTLTFCLPCDYDGLVEPGAIIVGGPEEIRVVLRQSTTFQFNATSPACPNETLVFMLESVEPQALFLIFSLNSATGELIVDGSGPNLDANGITEGYINVSVHVVNSNYTQVQDPHKETVIVPFIQPRTISVMSVPPSIHIDVTSPFSYQMSATSQLGQNLYLGQLVTFPSDLSQDVNITSNNQGHSLALLISGQISLNRTLPNIVLNYSTIPFLSIPISDDAGGIVYATTQLLINQSPPIFEYSHYEFNFLESMPRGATLGPIRTIDPNGYSNVVLPTISTDPSGNHQVFTVALSPDDQVPPYSTYVIVVLLEFDYELTQQRNFEVVAVERTDNSLRSTATVQVNILPVNEHSPVFVQDGVEVTITDNIIRRGFVAEVSAQDRDSGSDGIIDYNITSGNEDGYFIISGMGFGEVIVRKSPINPHTYHLTITASDRGNPSRSSTAIVIVNVIATNEVNCTETDFGPPILTSALPVHLVVPVFTNLTISCSWKANPEARGFKWERNKQSLIVGHEDPHYIITNNSLTIESVNSTDGGFYYYNVTNQCGSSILPFLVTVIDWPNAPTNVQVVEGPYRRIVALTWEVPSKATDPISGFSSQPVDGYIVQGRDATGNGGFMNFTSVLPVGTTTARITTLHPGTEYNIRILAVNTAGETPSQNITIITNTSVPQITDFRARAFLNNSILVEWLLEFDGGSPVTEFEIHVALQNSRPAMTMPTQPDLVYHKTVGTTSLITMPVASGYTYTARVTARNLLGPSQEVLHSVFVGSTGFSLCDFENGGTGGSGECPWQVLTNTVIRAAAASSPLPSIDATTRSDQGRFVFGEAVSGSERIVATLPRAGYACSITFFYFISDRSTTRLDLKSSSGQVIWSSTAESGMGIWTSATIPVSSQYFTSSVGDSIQFVVTAIGANGSIALDNIAVSFCLPCDFEQPQGSFSLSLSYSNNTRVFLRTPQTMPVEVSVPGCPNAALNFSIVRVIPSVISSMFSLASEDGRNISIGIDAISPSLVEPNSIGYLEIMVSIMNTDYKSSARLVSATATVEFLMVQAAENCTFGSSCLFSDEKEDCSQWTWGQESNIVNSLQPNINIHTGYYLYASSRNSEVLLLSSVINESFCQISFSYLLAQTAELTVLIEGLGVAWSSVEVPRISAWSKQSIRVDLRDAEIIPNRTMSLVARVGGGASLYAALDNLTMHPCIDCNTPVCTLLSCLPGHYYSLDHESCLACPRGYYCPDWRIIPKPCPAGTYGTGLDAVSIKTCLACPPSTFSIQPGSIVCQSCPPGFECSNASSIPLHLGDGTCPTNTPSNSNWVPILAGLGTALGGSCLMCICISLLLIMTCCRGNKGGPKGPRQFFQGSSDDLKKGLSMHKTGKHLKGKNLGKSSVRTMTSFLSYDSNVNHFTEERPWTEAEDMTVPSSSRQSDTGFSMTFSNDNCNDDDNDDERELIELRNK